VGFGDTSAAVWVGDRSGAWGGDPQHDRQTRDDPEGVLLHAGKNFLELIHGLTLMADRGELWMGSGGDELCGDETEVLGGMQV
jgi:hypothetical protein